MVLVPNVVLRPLDRVPQRIVSVQDHVKAQTIAGLRIVGMVALSKITKHPLNSAGIGVRADFQDFVVVNELSVFHDVSPGGSAWCPRYSFALRHSPIAIS